MNDRFKFRAYIKAEKRMGQVKSIDFWRSKGTICENGSLETHSKGDGLIVYRGLDEVELMQCTGLKDSTGKLIYEGDIFTSGEYPFTDEGKPNYVGEVVWIDEFANFQYYLHCVNPSKRGISEGINNLLENILCLNDVKIIGNIFENPDLLRRNVNE